MGNKCPVVWVKQACRHTRPGLRSRYVRLRTYWGVGQAYRGSKGERDAGTNFGNTGDTLDLWVGDLLHNGRFHPHPLCSCGCARIAPSHQGSAPVIAFAVDFFEDLP